MDVSGMFHYLQFVKINHDCVDVFLLPNWITRDWGLKVIIPYVSFFSFDLFFLVEWMSGMSGWMAAGAAAIIYSVEDALFSFGEWCVHFSAFVWIHPGFLKLICLHHLNRKWIDVFFPRTYACKNNPYTRENLFFSQIRVTNIKVNPLFGGLFPWFVVHIFFHSRIVILCWQSSC